MHRFVTKVNIKVTCKSCHKSTDDFNSSSVIGTDSCYGLFERGNKTVQAKNIKFCVGGPSCEGGGETFTSVYYYIYMRKSLSSATRPQIYAHPIELVELIPTICIRVPESAH